MDYPPAVLEKAQRLEQLLLQIAAEEWDRAAARRVEENRAMRQLFAGAAPEIGDPDLRARLEAASGSPISSLPTFTG